MDLPRRFLDAPDWRDKAARAMHTASLMVQNKGQKLLINVGSAAVRTACFFAGQRVRRTIYSLVALGFLIVMLLPALRYYFAWMNRQATQEKLQTLQHEQLLKEIGQPAKRVDALPDTERPVFAAPKKTSLTPQAKLAGKISQYTLEGWPIVKKSTIALFGIEKIDLSELDRTKSFLKQQGNHLNCQHKSQGRFRCLTHQDIDIAQAIILNGAATAAMDAPKEYKDAEAEAKAAKRGLWK